MHLHCSRPAAKGPKTGSEGSMAWRIMAAKSACRKRGDSVEWPAVTNVEAGRSEQLECRIRLGVARVLRLHRARAVGEALPGTS